MDTLLLGAPPPAVVDLLREAPWMEETPRRTGRFELHDAAVLGDVRLLIVASVTAEATTRWFVPVAGAGPVRSATCDAAFDRLVVAALRDGLDLPTARGNTVRFRGAPPAYRGQVPFDPGWCSNTLSLLDLGGGAHVHKTYRRIDTGTREPELLRLMAATGRTQQPAGDYTYVDTSTGRREPLGVVYRYAAGEGLNVPLRTGIRAVWPLLAAGGGPDAAVAASLRDLTAPLREAGRFLHGFHRDLAERLGGHPEGDAEAQTAEAARRLAALRPQILDDTRYPAAVRRAAVTGLERALSAVRSLPARPWPSGPCHGDLHLSHLLRRERADGTWEMCVIDLSTPSPDPEDPSTVSSPWQDLAALRRGLEIFAADEFTDHAAQTVGMDPEDTCRTALLQAAGVAPDTPGWTARRLAELDRLRAAAGLWATRAGDLLADPGPGSSLHPAWRLIRLRRLIHELEYAYAHDRAYHAAINLRHAVEASGVPASR
ncbi:phosphotransferase [Streptomyces sp. NPDC013953]|uniref:phosphotransferase n=1 Tax=Streptomyces sp. NPDC013953 TaxID=3364868 RepID=UPI0036FC86D2